VEPSRAYEDYCIMIKSLARNLSIDMFRLNMVLRILGKTGGNVSEDLLKEQKRLQLIDQLRGKGDLEAEARKVEADLSKLRNHYRNLANPILEQIREKQERFTELTNRIQDLVETEESLSEYCWDERVLRTFHSVEVKEQELRLEIQKAERDLEQLKTMEGLEWEREAVRERLGKLNHSLESVLLEKAELLIKRKSLGESYGN
jgi:hypothetical protein